MAQNKNTKSNFQKESISLKNILIIQWALIIHKHSECFIFRGCIIIFTFFAFS